MPLLAPAHVGHLAMLRTLIRKSAAEGSFDRDLAGETPHAEEFFAKLKRALVTGYFVETDARTGHIDTVAVPGYVFWPDGRNSSSAPAGFGLFRAIEDGGYELWLAGLEFAERGGGLGRALLSSLLATPPGQRTWVVRISRESRYGAAVAHLLDGLGFDVAGDSARLRWFVRRDAPPALVARIRGGTRAPSDRAIN
jgi:hypothetical protein